MNTPSSLRTLATAATLGVAGLSAVGCGKIADEPIDQRLEDAGNEIKTCIALQDIRTDKDSISLQRKEKMVFSFRLAEDAVVNVLIYNENDKEVYPSLPEVALTKGDHSAEWNGLDSMSTNLTKVLPGKYRVNFSAHGGQPGAGITCVPGTDLFVRVTE